MKLALFFTFGFSCLLVAPEVCRAQSVVTAYAPAAQQFLDSNGKPVANGLVYTYSAGTLSPLASYTNATGSAINANPVRLDASGRPLPAGIWLSPAAYKLVVTTASGSTVLVLDNLSVAPLDMVTTDTEQTIAAKKQFNGDLVVSNLSVTGTCTGCGGGGSGGSGGSGGGSFAAITTGINTAATMTLGPGSSIQSLGGNFTMGAAGRTQPVKTGVSSLLPPACTVGELYFATDATAGQNLYMCGAANVWTQQISGAGGASFPGISGGTNTTAAMSVGTGASLRPTGGGDIQAISLVASVTQHAVVDTADSPAAVNQVTVTNSATSAAPSIAATGTDANISLLLAAKGSGLLQLNSGLAYVDNSGNLNVQSCTGCGAGGGGGVTLPVVDATPIVKDAGATKLMRFDVSAVPGSSTVTLAVPSTSVTIDGLENAATFTGVKNFAANVTFNADNLYQVGTDARQAGVIYTRALMSKKVQFEDRFGGSNFWYAAVDATVGSDFLLIDNSGGTAFSVVQSGTGSPYTKFNGQLQPPSSNSSDIGGAGATWRSLYFDTSLVHGGVTRINSSGAGTFAGLTLSNVASGTQCLQANSSGIVTGTGGPCPGGGGGGTVTSISTSSPISGGTITSTGTISCPTCLTTAGGQTVSSSETFSNGIVSNGNVVFVGPSPLFVPYAFGINSGDNLFYLTSVGVTIAKFQGGANPTLTIPNLTVTNNATVSGTITAGGGLTSTGGGIGGTGFNTYSGGSWHFGVNQTLNLTNSGGGACTVTITGGVITNSTC